MVAARGSVDAPEQFCGRVTVEGNPPAKAVKDEEAVSVWKPPFVAAG
jgi:hypothetical protein